ncbi:MAG: branched-chain amino acid aminotransferase [Pseudobdellovibrionaceae bacterium]
MLRIPVQKCVQGKTKPNSQSLGFGQYFTDHLFQVKYSSQNGWHEPQVIPYGNFQIDPGASVLHYGQALFEGMKAFRLKDGGIGLFRPDYNCRRLQAGANRLCMQAPPAELMMAGIKELIKVDADWIPKDRGCSLYIRPTLIGTEAFLGVRPSNEYLFYVILSPVSSYYKEGLNPISIWVEEKYVRAAPGGLGATKAGANYAASLLAALEAKSHGYAQVLWLDVHHQYIEEVGTMNVFFVIDDEVITPSLDGTILAGGVRDSAIQLMRSWGLKVSERKLAMQEVLSALQSGRLKEAFGTGTAAVVSPMGELYYQGKQWVLNEKKIGPLAQKLYQEITAIQYGEATDSWGWIERL